MFQLSNLTSLVLTIYLLPTVSVAKKQQIMMLNNSSATLVNLRLEVTLHYSFSDVQPTAVLTTRMLDITDLLLHATLPCLISLHLRRVHASPVAVSTFLLQSSSLEKLSFLDSYFPLSSMPRGSFPNLRSIGPMYGPRLVLEQQNIQTLTSINPSKLEEFQNIPIWSRNRPFVHLGLIPQLQRIYWDCNVIGDGDPGEDARPSFQPFPFSTIQGQLPGVRMYDASTGRPLVA
jgi:hypothetical protein